jgi:hypothetical protein
LAALFAVMMLNASVWAGDTKDVDKVLIFSPLYYNQATGFGVIKDTKGTAVGEKGAFFKFQIKENGAHRIFYIEGYPEGLPKPGTFINSFPADTITMLLETYPKYNLM